MTPKFFKYFRHIVALIWVIGSFVFFYMLLFTPIPPENKEVLSILAGAIATSDGMILNYYFGNNKDKSDAESAARANQNP